MERPPSTFGDLLRSYRVRAGLSQDDLAGQSGISVRTLRDIEQGRVDRPRARTVTLLATALRLTDTERARLQVTAAGAGRPDDPRKLRIGVLGPLVVRQPGGPVSPGGAAQQCLLGLLALRHGQVVSRDEIVEVLWGLTPPKGYPNQIQVYVRRLRRLLEPDSATRTGFRILVRAGGGYRLDCDGDALDVARFDDLAARGSRASADGHVDMAEEFLAQALECWRGPVLGAAEPRLAQHPAAAAIADRRVDAALAYAQVAADVGGHQKAAGVLRRVTADEPLHEGLHARLMLALAAAGQQAAALQVFEVIRGRLDRELGIDPGAEVRAAYLRVLRQQVPADGGHGTAHLWAGAADATPDAAGQSSGTPPAQLPANAAVFTGRAGHLAELDRLLVRGPGREVAISAIDGTPGVGKTALVVHWAHRVRDRFPDGQLYVDLRGYASAPPMRPVEALAQFLRGLGVAPEQVPAQVEEAAALYRSLLADRRLLVVLDNAHDAEQVRPLLPGSPGCLVLVTSRDRLAGLVARDGARRLVLDVLPAEEAHRLLTRLLGGDRVAAEPEATAALAEACAFLPLALRIAAANLMDGAHGSIAAYVAALRHGDALGAFEVHGDEQAAVRAAFDLSYNGLEPEVRRLFRLLGLVPGPEFTAEAVAALAGIGVRDAGRLLERLSTAHLVDQQDPGRYRCHDLIRRYAAERTARDDSEPHRRAAAQRLYDYYLATVDAAAGLVYPGLVRLPPPTPPVPAVPGPPEFADHAGALAWLDTERPNLLAAVTHTARHGPAPVAWFLADSLRGYFYQCMHVVDWLTAARAGLTAAQAGGDRRAEAAAHLSLGTYHWYQGEHRQAVDHHSRTLTLAQETAWIDGQAAALGNLGSLYRQLGRLDQAVEHQLDSLALNRLNGRLVGEASSLLNLGTVWMDLGRLEQAAEDYRYGLTLYRQAASLGGEAACLANLADAYQMLGRPDEALRHLTRAASVAREIGDRSVEAEILCSLAAVHRDAGRYHQALDHAEAALSVTRETGDHYTQACSLISLGSVLDHHGRHQQSIGHHQQALRLARDNDYRYLEAQALVGLATAHHRLGQSDAALTCVDRAVTRTRSAGYRIVEGQALAVLAGVRHRLGEHRRAVEHARQALVLHEQTGYRLGQARAHLTLGRALRDVGGVDAAATHWRQALTLFTDIGSPLADEPRTLLAALDASVAG